MINTRRKICINLTISIEDMNRFELVAEEVEKYRKKEYQNRSEAIGHAIKEYIEKYEGISKDIIIGKPKEI